MSRPFARRNSARRAPAIGGKIVSWALACALCCAGGPFGFQRARASTVDVTPPRWVQVNELSSVTWSDAAVIVFRLEDEVNGGLHSLTLPNQETLDLRGKTTFNGTYEVYQNGTYTFFYRDAAGNTASRTVEVNRLDTSAPSVQLLTDLPSIWTKEEVALTYSVSDSHSGLKKITLVRPDGEKVAQSLGTDLNMTSQSVTLEDNGRYQIIALDNAGNETVKPFVVTRIDRQTPKIDYTVEEKDGVKTVAVKASDAESGVKTVGKKDADAIEGDTATFTVEGDTLEVEAVDNAGNSTGAVKIDLKQNSGKKPVVGYKPTDVYTWRNTDLKIDLYAQDEAVGLESVTLDDAAMSIEGGNTWQLSAELGQGKHTLSAKNKNSNGAKLEIECVEKDKPKISLPPDNVIRAFQQIRAKDDLSGVATVELIIGSTKISSASEFAALSSNRQSGIIRVTDNAGNVAEFNCTVEGRQVRGHLGASDAAEIISVAQPVALPGLPAPVGSATLSAQGRFANVPHFWVVRPGDQLIYTISGVKNPETTAVREMLVIDRPQASLSLERIDLPAFNRTGGAYTVYAKATKSEEWTLVGQNLPFDQPNSLGLPSVLKDKTLDTIMVELGDQPLGFAALGDIRITYRVAADATKLVQLSRDAYANDGARKSDFAEGTRKSIGNQTWVAVQEMGQFVRVTGNSATLQYIPISSSSASPSATPSPTAASGYGELAKTGDAFPWTTVVGGILLIIGGIGMAAMSIFRKRSA